ncbi:MAG: hypothetical protein Fur0032_20800 [Terrimicrobiaceae bacterium]
MNRLLSYLRAIRDAPRRYSLIRERSRLVRSQSALPCIGMGGVLSPGRLIHGGAVKLLTLARHFDCNDSAFNILYAVSSAQPDFAADLAQQCHSRGIPMVWNQNGVGYPAWAGNDSEFHNASMRKLRNMADFVIYQSEFCRRSAERFLGPSNKPSATLLNPVDLNKFSPAKVPLSEHPIRLLAMGTQNYRGRVSAALQTLANLRSQGVESRLTIAGRLLWKGAEDDVASEARALGISEAVQRMGAFTQDEALEIYRSHHILLHPKFMDPCPTVVAEALACGLPVVAPSTGGIPEMVDASCSRLVPAPEDWDSPHTPAANDMAAAVIDVAAHLAQMSKNARLVAESRFDSAQWVEAHWKIFSAVLSGTAEKLSWAIHAVK